MCSHLQLSEHASTYELLRAALISTISRFPGTRNSTADRLDQTYTWADLMYTSGHSKKGKTQMTIQN